MKNFNPKISLIVLGLATSSLSFGQNQKAEISGSESVKYGLQSNTITPQVLLGQIGANTATNNLKLELKEEKFELQGIAWQADNGATAAIKVSGKNENNNVGIFSGAAINPKFIGDVSFTFPLKAWISYDANSNKNIKEVPYESIKNNISEYKNDLIRDNYFFLTGGVTTSGAKYNLIDSTVSPEKMISKRKYSGFSLYGQFNAINYNYAKNRTIFHSVRANYGNVNNVSDLTEYNISTSTAYAGAAVTQKVEQKRTGYYDMYTEQNRAVLSYEISSCNMDTTNSRVGYLLGVDYLINSKTNDFTRFNAGITFPVKVGTKRVYVAGILTSTDFFNALEVDDFKEENTLSFNLKLATDLKINYGKKK